MAYLKPKDFYAQLRKQEYRPVYLFTGEEVFQQEEAWRFLARKLRVDSMNLEIFYCGEMSMNDLMLAAQTHPFMSEKRLLIVKDAHKLKSADTEVLSEFLKTPLESVCMVIIWPAKLKKESRNSVFFKTVEASGDVIEFRAYYERELPEWIREKAREQSKKISEEAVGLLISETGTNLLDLNNELEKLSLYCAKKDSISAEDVENMSGHARQSSLNALAEAVESGKTSAALKVLEGLLSEGEVPLKILATIYRVLRRMLAAKSMLEEKKSSRADVQRELNLNAYFDRNFFSNLSRFSREGLQKYVETVADSDRQMKSTSKPECLILEELVLSLSAD